MNFIEVGNEWVNLDFVRSIHSVGFGKDQRWFIHGENAKWETPTDPTINLGRQIVHAARGETMVVVTIWKDGHSVDTVRVVAWRIDQYEAHPIPAGAALLDNQHLLIPLPGGKYEHPNIGTWDTLDEAVEGLLADYQEPAQ